MADRSLPAPPIGHQDTSDPAFREHAGGSPGEDNGPGPGEPAAPQRAATSRPGGPASEEEPARGFFHAIDELVFVLDQELRIITLNRAARDRLGYSEEDLTGQPVVAVCAEDKRQEVGRVIADTLAGEPRSCTAPVTTKTGRHLAVEIRLMPGVWGGRDVFFMVAKDVSKLEESAEKFTKAFQSNAALMAISTPEDGRIVDVNDVFLQTLGFTREEVIGKTSRELGLFADFGQRTAVFQTVKEKGYARNADVTVRTKNGELRFGSFSADLIHMHDQQYLFTVMTDLTERRRTEEELRRLAMAVEQAFETIMITDLEGRITYVNPAFERTTGYRREEVLGENPRLMKSGEHNLTFYRHLWQTITSGETWTGRLINRRKDLSRLVEEVAISPIRSASGEIISYVAVKRDITDQVQLEEQLRQAHKMEAIGRLAGGVAHDLNNLLCPILGYSELLLDCWPAGQWGQAELREIHKATNRAKDLTHQLLAFSRKQVLQMRTVDLGAVVTGFEEILKRTIREDIELEIRLEARGNVRADPAQLQQVVMNLAVNAQEAMPHGGKLSITTADLDLDQAHAETRPGLRPGPHVMLEIRDTGCGMDRETVKKAFEPFFTTKTGTGTGLGLATVHGIVKQHGGDVAVVSEPGQGTTFKIYFPQVEPVADRPPPAPPVKPRTERGTETVLVVEDSDAVRRLVSAILKGHGYHVIAAARPSECLHVVEHYQGSVDLLVTDVVMPQMNGKELYQRLTTVLPGLKVLYMSGYPDEVIGLHGVLEEGVDFLQKPVSVAALIAKVRTILDRRGPEPAAPS